MRAGQALQTPEAVAAAADEKLPAGQSVQAPGPGAVLYLPATHAVHVPPFDPVWPALQRHSALPSLPAVMLLYVSSVRARGCGRVQRQSAGVGSEEAHIHAHLSSIGYMRQHRTDNRHIKNSVHHWQPCLTISPAPNHVSNVCWRAKDRQTF